jgi:Flp pilus assembly protein TadD
LVLSDLLLRNYINTIVTTNFDDLVYIASTTFTGNRPIVYAYGILASEMKVNSPHSKVLKLHGDYLYSNIVNTADEMHAQSNAVKNPVRDSREFISNLNMERQVRSVLDNFGLIVVGYSGGDKTIMGLLKDVSENNGFYWCYVKGYPPDTDVLDLVQSKNGKLIEINGFDDLFKEIADITGFTVETLVESFDKRKDDLVTRIIEFNKRYSRKPLNEYAEELKKEKYSKNLSASDYFVLAYKAYDDGDFTLAELHNRKAIELNPQYAEAYNNLGVLLDKDESRWTEAEECYRKAIELNPQDADAYYNLGILLSKGENRQMQAEECYRKAIELNPEHSYAYNNLGILLVIDENRRTEAEECYRKAFELNPQNANAYHNLGNMLFKQGKIEEAKTAFETSAKVDEKYADPLISLAGIYKRKGNSEETKKYADKARAILKEDDFYNLACLNAILEEKDEALKYLKLAVERGSSIKLLAKTDSDFDWIRDDERFWEIVGK